MPRTTDENSAAAPWKEAIVRAETGRPVPWSEVIGQGPDCTVVAQTLTAYSEAMRIDLLVSGRQISGAAPMRFLPYALVAEMDKSDLPSLPDDFLRFAVLIDDVIATNLRIRGSRQRGERALISDGGHGTNDLAKVSYWVRGLPDPAGRLELIVEWLAAGIPETRTPIDTALVMEAAAQSKPLSRPD